jgi:hypothetical protein
MLPLQRAHRHHPPHRWLKLEQRRKIQSTSVLNSSVYCFLPALSKRISATRPSYKQADERNRRVTSKAGQESLSHLQASDSPAQFIKHHPRCCTSNTSRMPRPGPPRTWRCVVRQHAPARWLSALVHTPRTIGPRRTQTMAQRQAGIKQGEKGTGVGSEKV